MGLERLIVNKETPLGLQIEDAVRDAGYRVGSTPGKEKNPRFRVPQVGGIAILKFPEEEHGKLDKMLGRRKKGVILSTLWWSNRPRGATSEKWIAEVDGKEQLEEAENLANHLSTLFDVDIEVNLESELTRYEKFGSDFDYF